MLSGKKGIHFVGVGGIGMSGIAYILSEMGHAVSGSDLEPNNLTRRLEAKGGRIFKGHSAGNLPENTDILVYSSAIDKENAELVEAARRNIRVAHRAEILGELMNARDGIAVTGTHGKTTMTSLIAIMLEKARLDPTVIIGGEVSDFKGNAKLGKGRYLVAEADESDSSFLNLKPLYSVVANIEMEHLDHYKTLEDLIESYSGFIRNTKRDGTVFYNYEDDNIRKALAGYGGKKKSFGFSNGADMRAADIRMNGFKTSFTCIYRKRALGRVHLSIPGRHNILNALAAILVGLEIGLDFKTIARSIRRFTGTKRRFDLRADAGGVMLIDDYAHHPTEIRAVLDACRNWKNKRVIAIFQPHRYTRTLFLADEFGRCFSGADKLILTDIYAASEHPIDGVSVRNIYDRARQAGLEDIEIMEKGRIADHVMRVAKRGDMVVVMGAGDIKKVADELAEKLNESTRRVKEEAVAGLKRFVRGSILLNEPLSCRTTFRIGGPADIWVEPADIKDLKRTVLFAKKERIPIFVIGKGSNVLVKDNGFRGMVINLGSTYFKRMMVNKERVRLGAGFSLAKLVRICCDRGLEGLESLVGIPGTIGGAIYMNAGGSSNPIYRNIGDFVTSIKVMDLKGDIRRISRKDMKLGYRSSNLSGLIILEADLKLNKADPDILNSRCLKFLKIKREKQVLDVPSAGCVFKNPQDSQFTCGQMIDMLGLKGRRVGGAEISEKHANFIVNRNRASCEDVLRLAEYMKDKVKENYGIPLELEIEIV